MSLSSPSAPESPPPRWGLSPSVWLLGWVSFFTDMATEMIYPLLPMFLTRTLGAGAVALGLIEGAAEAANSILKIISGRLSDRWGVRKQLVLAGYSISSAVRPLIALVNSWVPVLLLRIGDRLGKGIRGAPRDAMLAELAHETQRGRVYGFHRAMDHAGAITGPLIASAFLLWRPGEYRTLFALSVIPGIIVILLLLRVPEDPSLRLSDAALDRRDEPAGSWRALPVSFYKAMGAMVVFALGNSADAFLLLNLTEAGVPVTTVPLLWSGLHVIKASASLAGGALSDRLGRRTLISAGWLVYAAVYAGFALADDRATIVALFFVYGMHFGLAEAAEKALVAELSPASLHGTAFGIYNAVFGIGALLASIVFGLIWWRLGRAAAFATGAALALVATGLLVLMVRGGVSSRSGTRR